MNHKKLLIFDLNKVLLCKNKHRKSSYFLRPFVNEFIIEMMSLFDIAVWTSGKSETMNNAMNELFGNNKNKLIFYWTQKECTKIDDIPPYMFKKELIKVWECFPQYNQHNTILLDDSPDKCQFNPPFTTVHPRPFDVYELYHEYEMLTMNNNLNIMENVISLSSSSSSSITPITTTTLNVSSNNNPNENSQQQKRGIKRRRGTVSKYEVCCEMDTELKRGGPLWLYLTSIANYPGNTDEYLENNEYNV